MMRKIFVMISWLTRTRHLSENNTDHDIHKYEIWTILFGSFLSLKRFKYFIEEPLESNSNWSDFFGRHSCGRKPYYQRWSWSKSRVVAMGADPWEDSSRFENLSSFIRTRYSRIRCEPFQVSTETEYFGFFRFIYYSSCLIFFDESPYENSYVYYGLLIIFWKFSRQKMFLQCLIFYLLFYVLQ